MQEFPWRDPKPCPLSTKGTKANEAVIEQSSPGQPHRQTRRPGRGTDAQGRGGAHRVSEACVSAGLQQQLDDGSVALFCRIVKRSPLQLPRRRGNVVCGRAQPLQEPGRSRTPRSWTFTLAPRVRRDCTQSSRPFSAAACSAVQPCAHGAVIVKQEALFR